MTALHALLPRGIDDPRHPSGGNTYDRRLLAGLASLGWTVHEHLVDPCDVPAALCLVPDRATVLVDGLVGAPAAETLLEHAARLRLVALVHLPFRTPREPELLAACAAVVTTSQWSRGWLEEHYGLCPDRVHVVPPGVSAAPLARPSPSGGRLLCVGPATTAKGYADLLVALDLVQDLEWQCTWVGATDLEPTGTGRRVRHLGALPPDRLAAAYAEADLLVHPSHLETYGMGLTEALAHGVPVVATDVGGVHEALGQPAGELPALLVPPHDPEALADALRRWLTVPPLRQQLREAACTRRRSLRTWGRTVVEAATLLAAVNRRPLPAVDRT
jgi:glycosyltransferase involved in cell wall biosynthesis